MSAQLQARYAKPQSANSPGTRGRIDTMPAWGFGALGSGRDAVAGTLKSACGAYLARPVSQSNPGGKMKYDGLADSKSPDDVLAYLQALK